MRIAARFLSQNIHHQAETGKNTAFGKQAEHGRIDKQGS